jgi:hypothetical protein
VLITGGVDQGPLDYAERYIPGQPLTVHSPRMSTARISHTATLLPDGLVLIAGSNRASGMLDSAEIFQPGP